MMENKSMIVCPELIYNQSHKWKVFLMGPIQGAQPWQYTVPEIPNVVWLNPRRKEYPVKDFQYQTQVKWETEAILSSNIILAWIPAQTVDHPDRSYAQTTRWELGEYIAKGKTVILGADPGFPGRKYLEYKAKEYSNVRGVFGTLAECIEDLEHYIHAETMKGSRVWFTADTHFSSERALELSKRPFRTVQEMDWTMIQRWNDVVRPMDYVFHLGDFGDGWPLYYLTGSINFIEGNDERDGKSSSGELLASLHPYNHITICPQITTLNVISSKYEEDGSVVLILGHKPTDVLKELKDGQFGVFGHIHGIQLVKPFGIDAGVDCHNFTPIDADTILFYRNAVRKGFYDQDVWIN